MPNITEIIKLGPGAVLALLLIGVVYFILVRFTAAIDKLGARLEEAVDCNSAVLLGLQAQLLTHDLTVSGLNPSAGATIDERTNRAYIKYLEVQRQLEDARSAILRRHNERQQT